MWTANWTRCNVERSLTQDLPFRSFGWVSYKQQTLLISNVGLGMVLSQSGEHGEHAVMYYSRALSPPERNYCVICRELLAYMVVLRHSPPFLYKQFPAVDGPCVAYMAIELEPEGQLAWGLERLQDYALNIQHRAGLLARKCGCFVPAAMCRTSVPSLQADRGACTADSGVCSFQRTSAAFYSCWCLGSLGDCVGVDARTPRFCITKTLCLPREHFYWPGCHMDAELYVHCAERAVTVFTPLARWRLPQCQWLAKKSQPRWEQCGGSARLGRVVFVLSVFCLLLGVPCCYHGSQYMFPLLPSLPGSRAFRWPT